MSLGFIRLVARDTDHENETMRARMAPRISSRLLLCPACRLPTDSPFRPPPERPRPTNLCDKSYSGSFTQAQLTWRACRRRRVGTRGSLRPGSTSECRFRSHSRMCIGTTTSGLRTSTASLRAKAVPVVCVDFIHREIRNRGYPEPARIGSSAGSALCPEPTCACYASASAIVDLGRRRFKLAGSGFPAGFGADRHRAGYAKFPAVQLQS